MTPSLQKVVESLRDRLKTAKGGFVMGQPTTSTSVQLDDLSTLLDAHAGALRDAERYRWLRQQAMFGDYGCPPGPHWWLPMFSDTETSGLTFDDVVDAARAALATNTRGAV